MDNRSEAERLRDEGIERAYRAALEEWKRNCLNAIQFVASIRDEFTTDAVWTVLDRWDVIPPREPRAISGVLRDAKKAGYCHGTGRLVKSVLSRGHTRWVQVYRSELR